MNNKCFLDLEVNQREGRNENYILQVGAVTSDGQELSYECHHPYNIKPKISYLLKLENLDYFKKLTLTEKDAYIKLLHLSKKYELYVYGNYDQVVLDGVARRYSLPKIKVIDYSKNVYKSLEITKQYPPSLKTLKLSLDINLDNIKEHNALSDAKVLSKIYEIFTNMNKEQIASLKQKIQYEEFRPKLNIQEVYAKYIEAKVKDDYLIYVLEYLKIPKVIEKLYINEAIDEYVEMVKTNEKEIYRLTIFDNKGNFIEQKEESFDNVDKKNSNAKKAIKSFNIDFNNSIVICKKSIKNYFISKLENKKVFNVVYSIPLVIYERYKNIIGMNKIAKIIKFFYAYSKFDKIVDYTEIENCLKK